METIVDADKADRPAEQQCSYRGRVRSGCSTCRSRKVKCDEKRPNCHNCTRLGKVCIYKPRPSRHHASKNLSDGGAINAASPEPVRALGASTARGIDSASPTPLSPVSQDQRGCNIGDGVTPSDSGSTGFSSETINHPFLYPDEAIVNVTARLEETLRHRNTPHTTTHDANADHNSPSALISRDIELTTTMDILAAGEVSQQPLFSFFVDTVDCPPITIYDNVNWQRMKLEIVDLGMSRGAIASAITAVSMLYKAVILGLPLSKALALYQSAKISYKELLNDETQNIDIVLVASFLLCIFEFVHYEMNPTLKSPEDRFIERLGAWTRQENLHSPLLRRITVWLRLLYAATIRGGGKGLIADNVYDLLPNYSSGTCNQPFSATHLSDTPTYLYEMLSTPLFDFYDQLQAISTDVAKLTHYHRSRSRGKDQEEVVERISQIKLRLHELWESRSATQRQAPQDLRSHLAPKIADPIITVIGVCSAAYHAEFIEMGRVLGDPVSELTESRQAMVQVRDIVEGDWNAYDGFKLNAAYLRPLFLYAIECMDRQDSHWAVEKLKHIKNPISRSDFFAAFAEELSDAQLRKERRVTSKYFCIWHFGVPPPYL